MRDNPGGELNSAECVRRRCKKNSPSVLSGMGKRTIEDCDLAAKTVYSGRDGEGPVPSRKSKESGRIVSCEKDFVSKKSSGYA